MREFEDELRLDSTNANASYELAEIYRQAGELDKAGPLFELSLSLTTTSSSMALAVPKNTSPLSTMQSTWCQPSALILRSYSPAEIPFFPTSTLHDLKSVHVISWGATVPEYFLMKSIRASASPTDSAM